MWKNPLMGWSASRDPMNQIERKLYFDTFEEAKTWATTNGMTFSDL
jgi:hypothetical protein